MITCSLFSHTPLCCYIDTTDIQAVEVMELMDMTLILIQCTFIESSSAKGCFVLFQISSDKESFNKTLMRSDMSSSYLQATVPMDLPLSCYKTISAYDIEADGSVGMLPIPAQRTDVEDSHSSERSIAKCDGLPPNQSKNV